MMSPAPCPAMAILPPGIQVVDVEAMWLDDRLTFDVDPADVEDGVGVRVRFRYRSDEPRAKDTGTEHINRVYAKWPREIVYVPVADLKREV